MAGYQPPGVAGGLPYSPGRPSTIKDITTLVNGDLGLGLGVLTSTGAAVNNVSTAVPFATGALQVDGVSRDLVGSLAGRVLLVQAIASGFILTSPSPLIGIPGVTTVALQSTIPPVASTFPGFSMTTGQTGIITMSSKNGWLQWISSAGTASLVVWELS